MTAPARAIRFMTWNIHGGVGPDGQHNLARVLSLIQKAKPDVLALQEVDSRIGDREEHPLALFRRVLGHHGMSGAAITSADGDYGQALLSRWPLADESVHDISVDGREPRRAMTVRIATPFGNVFVVATHLGLRFAERRIQARRLLGLCKGGRGPVVAMGDFNDWIWPGSVQRALAELLPEVTRHRTFPASLPLFRLDRIFCGPGAVLMQSWVDPAASAVSDHLPVIADIELESRLRLVHETPARQAVRP